MKLRDFHKYDKIDIACSKKVTLSQSSNKKAITNDAKFFIFAMPPVRRVRARRNKESSTPSNVDTVTSLDYQHTDVEKCGPCRRITFIMICASYIWYRKYSRHFKILLQISFKI